jgi:MYXO-CTERM domain-containing protein
MCACRVEPFAGRLLLLLMLLLLLYHLVASNE